MQGVNPSLREPIINGHFDPFSLSISETIEDISWRERIDSLSIPGVNAMSSLSKIRKLSSQLSDRDLIAELISTHEQRHYKDYASSELGLLFTFVHQLRLDVMNSYIASKNAALLTYFPVYNTIINSFYTSNYTQQQAVDALNLFFSKEFSNVAEGLFKTTDPDAPCSPHSYFCFQNILEASAILGEISIINNRCGDDPQRAAKLLRPEDRDGDLYFGLISYLFKEVPCYSAISMLIRYSLDSRVPIIGSPLVRSIYWHDLHPGYRLVNFTRSLKEMLLFHKLDMDFLENLDLTAEQNIKLQRIFLNFTHHAGKKLGKLAMWDDKEVAAFEPNASSLINSLTERSQQLVRLNFPRWRIIMEHIYESHNRFKKDRQLNALLFYTTSIFGLSEAEVTEMRNFKLPEHSFVLFSIFDGKVTSIHKNKKWLPAFARLIERDIAEMLLDEVAKNNIVDSILKMYPVLVTPEFDDQYRTWVNRIASQIFADLHV
jgi:hypothetical protein